MKQETIVLVQKSFKQVAPIADKVGAMFYGRLFETHPELRPMFPEDMQFQEKKLVQMLAMVVNSLHRFTAILPAVEALGRRHQDYGVVTEHYHHVGDALIWTLEEALGDAFTPALKQAWITAYGTVFLAMISATEEPARVQ